MKSLALWTLTWPIPASATSMTAQTEHFANAAIWAAGAGAIAHFGFHKNFWLAAGLTAAAIYANYLIAYQIAQNAQSSQMQQTTPIIASIVSGIGTPAVNASINATVSALA